MELSLLSLLSSIQYLLVCQIILFPGQVYNSPAPNMSRSTIIYVPGAFHEPDAYNKVILHLAAKGFRNRKVYLPSVGRTPPVSSIEPDVQAIRNAALAEMHEGQDVTVVCHSYGGVPTSQALQGLGVPQATGGGRVSAIVYIASALVFEGATLASTTQGYSDRGTSNYTEVQDDGNLFFKKGSDPGEVFYNDLSSEESRFWVSKLKPHASSTFIGAANYTAWKDIPSWYLICNQDKVLFPELQRKLIQEARNYLDQVGGSGTGEQRLKSEEIDASHFPFLSRPKDTAAFIERASLACIN